MVRAQKAFRASCDASGGREQRVRWSEVKEETGLRSRLVGGHERNRARGQRQTARAKSRHQREVLEAGTEAHDQAKRFGRRG